MNMKSKDKPKNQIFFMIFLGIFFISNNHSIVLASNAEIPGIEHPSEILSAPDFELKSLVGEQVTLRQYKGKIVLINFWATWCQPCLKEMPSINALYQKYKDKGLVVLAISADRGRESAVKKFSIDNALTFPVLLDPDGIVRNKYEVTALPYSYIINSEGKFEGRVIGEREWDNPQIINFFEKILKERVLPKKEISKNE